MLVFFLLFFLCTFPLVNLYIFCRHIFPQEAKRGGEEEVDDSGQDDQDEELKDDVGRGAVKQDGVQDDENGRCLEEKSEAEIEATRSKKPFYYMVFLSISLFG